MISEVTRAGGTFPTWNQTTSSLFHGTTGGVTFTNPWFVEELDHNAVDQQTVESCYKWLDRVVRLCQNPRLNLKNSPPYLLDTMPDIYEKLRSIISSYSDDYETLSQMKYFRVFVHSVTDKCKRTVKLFKDAGDKIFDVHSHSRFRLVKLSLIFSHLLKDLEALFPQNIFCAEFRITKPDAARWWSSNFGASVVVPWSAFQSALLQTFRVDSNDQLGALRNTIDLTCNEYVSIFEFDVFIRLFQPWNNILETWKALAVLHPGYMAFMTYDEVKARLKQYRAHPGPGTYVFRLSCTKLGQWAIGYVTEDLKILQTIIQNKSLAQALLDGEREGFYLYPNGKSSPSSLLHQLVHELPQVRLQVTQEQYQVYCEMGSTFELCKICDENNKDVQLEPCGHLICKHCLLNCRSAGCSQTCPFCRLEIKGIEDVIVDPYRPGLSHRSGVYDAFHNSNSGNGHLRKVISASSQSNGSLEISELSPSSAPVSRSITPVTSSFTVHPPPVPPRNPASVCSLSLPNYFKHNHSCLHLSSDAPRCIRLMQDSDPPLIRESSRPSKLPSCSVLPATIQTTTYHSPCQPTDVDRGVIGAYGRTLDPLDEAFPSAFQSNPLTYSPLENIRFWRLNYAQLDLSPSDSDKEGTAGVNISDSVSTVNQLRQTTGGSHPDGNQAHFDLSTRPPMSTTQMDLPQEPTASDLINQIPDSIIATSTGATTLITRLLLQNADLDETTADLLLSITHNDLNMACQVWKYFMPRSVNES
ncbi:E3 ubiquitin protein ligase CBL [Fasciola gigantica]|uniref:E3 ubiquitin-protein ligase CBL n=1 Tax=Fasciola gigantica TaxID=46835 RepID=A0A504YUY0_FASGI|nr:E3 ubiquitin protein ligase CBL [Fasciola gigantica]